VQVDDGYLVLKEALEQSIGGRPPVIAVSR
jgi:hypothetical protein